MLKQNLVYIYKGVLFSNKKKWITATRRKPENMLSERSQTQRPHIIRFHVYKMLRIGKSIETESRLVIVRGLQDEGMDSDRQWVQGFFFFFFLMFIYFERESRSRGGAERGRERIPSRLWGLSAQSPMQALIPQTMRSWLEPKSRVGHLTDWATQVLWV